jgi:hypothetical protein
MVALTSAERETIEDAFYMRGGYVLNFSDRTFSAFFGEDLGVDIDDAKYKARGTSKANRLRTFIASEDAAIVARALRELWEYRESVQAYHNADKAASLKGRLFAVIARIEGAAVARTDAIDRFASDETGAAVDDSPSPAPAPSAAPTSETAAGSGAPPPGLELDKATQSDPDEPSRGESKPHRKGSRRGPYYKHLVTLFIRLEDAPWLEIEARSDRDLERELRPKWHKQLGAATDAPLPSKKSSAFRTAIGAAKKEAARKRAARRRADETRRTQASE